MSKTIRVLFATMTLFVVGCTTIERPDMGVVKNAGKKYKYVQPKLFGMIPLKPKMEAIPGQMEKTQGILQTLGKWGLYISLPLSILAAIAGAIMVTYIQDRKTARLCMIASIALFLIAIFFTAWLLATTYMWLFIPMVALFVCGGIYLLYKVTLGASPKTIKEALAKP